MQIKLRRKGQTALVETKGGELVSYRDAAGTEYIWSGDERYWPGRNPLLFPIVGAMPNGIIEVDGVAFPMQKHGFARWREFCLIAQGESWCELELCSDTETLEQYPFAFRLRVRQELQDAGFTTAVSVYNPGERGLPFCVGAHPAFRCPLRAGEEYDDYILKFDACKDVFVPEHSIFDRQDAVLFEDLISRSISLVHRENGHGLRLNFSDFPILAVWSMPHKNAPFLCLEPWHGYPHGEGERVDLREKRYCIHLAPGEIHRVSYSVEAI